MAKKKSISGIHKLIYLLNSLFAIALLISYILPYISPIKAPKIATLSLLFPILFICNLFFLLYWLLQGKKKILLSLIVLVVGFNHFDKFYKISKPAFDEDESNLSIMSYNVRMLNHYGWTDVDSIPLKIETYLREKKPQVLLLQEFYNKDQFAADHPYHYVKMKSKGHKFGLAIFSNFPIVNRGSLDFNDSANNVIYCDIKLPKDTVRFYNVHLESLKLNPDEENFGEEDSEKLIDRLAQAFQKQSEQVAILKTHLEAWKGKTILAGDFNNTAFSWVYKQLKGSRLDTFEEAGQGFGKTFDYFFPLRIDFILADNYFSVKGFETDNIEYSDHFPIMTHLNLP